MDRDEVEALVDNVASFHEPQLELVIVDGGSSDGTLEMLQARDTQIDYWLSEADTGVYDAMNKGLAAARGEYVLHLNAGDRLLHIPIPELALCSRDKVDVACFCVKLDCDSTHIPKHDASMRTTNTWHHQGTFYRRSAHLGYDSTYRVFGDFDHNQRLAQATRAVRMFYGIVSSHSNAGLSASNKHFKEVYRSIRRNSGLWYVALAFIRFKLDGLRRRLSALSTRDKRHG